ncbi:YlqD family protein [Prochlorococcus sp. AH-716-E13]|nr:YlqD family protein [Prochlorococcus sp. AH-716-E13]
METKNSISIKRSIAIKAIVTPTWKEDAEKELSNAISAVDQQLSQLEQEGQQIVSNIRSQSVNPLDPRVQEQVGQVQQQVGAKRNELEEQKRNLLQQQSQVRDLKMDEIVDQGQVDSFCHVSVGDNLIKKMQVSITVKDGIIQSINNNE